MWARITQTHDDRCELTKATATLGFGVLMLGASWLAAIWTGVTPAQHPVLMTLTMQVVVFGLRALALELAASAKYRTPVSHTQREIPI